MFKLKTHAVLFLLLVAGCTQNRSGDQDPKQRLKDYISASFSMNSEDGRKVLLSFLTGEAKSRLAAWSDEQFRKAFIEAKRNYMALKFREVKPLSSDEVHIVYELTYMDQGRGTDAKVTNKKLCQMVRDKGTWYIKDVRSIKELVEYQNELSLP
jgi:hypothetical protein